MPSSHRPACAPGLTKRLAATIAGLRASDIPAEASATVRRGLVDCVGVMIAGSGEPVVGRVMTALGPSRCSEARLLPDGPRRAAGDAALLNGIAAHVHDYDDVALDGHPSAVLVPALLAEGEATGAKGSDLIRGYVAGYETWAALWKASPEPLHARAWHPSGVFGAVAAAAACAALRRLDASQTTNALGLAAAQASGLIANFGTLAKSFQVGRAAESGLLSARMAMAGVDASDEVFEHKAGFLRAFAGGDKSAAGGYGNPDWAILTEGLDIKIYPVCYATHRLIDCALQMRRDHAIPLESIASVELRLGSIQSDILRNHCPRTVLEAKFSCEFAVAAALAEGSVRLGRLTEEFVLRGDVQSLIARTRRTIDPEIGEAPFSPYDQVTLALTDGRTFQSQPVRYAAGSRHAHPSQSEAWAKFEDAAGARLPVGAARKLFDALWWLDPETPVASLLDDTGMRTAA